MDGEVSGSWKYSTCTCIGGARTLRVCCSRADERELGASGGVEGEDVSCNGRLLLWGRARERGVVQPRRQRGYGELEYRRWTYKGGEEGEESQRKRTTKRHRAVKFSFFLVLMNVQYVSFVHKEKLSPSLESG